ncbi:type IA DNA topoisomerase [Eubacterium sp. am_0171]|uniref:type IA DNA topoisomerase n=1 Tax=unclassified Eubacterium (in: firmicutes) TaxID=2624479 RepID=UPI00101F6976|nr:MULTISPECIES: type IA DNA topoisomerase [unclassified Eubacterium (in: firmicutes)]MSC86277.1 DNA topoisomerase III [Eubacterium sp. BIOML-A1]MSD08611.1 DNA topoisomerase III [Eubacterium sp. BIOML-A2]RYT11807.1 type IA DNA topoisomerase [Eubacterium sp. am_0171]
MTNYRLVVCEKPSVAKSIAAVLDAKKREDGYLFGNGFIVSWCFGHLAELADADAYDEKYGKWRREDLPILPEAWQYTVARDKKKQLDLLRALMNRDDVSEVINACDAGREGELIFRTVYCLNKCRKPMKRLWISSMEDAAILSGFENLKDGSEYDSLYASALCRSKADWLVGINATRLFSVMYHRTLNVGRVVSPTLALLVRREAEISAFQPEAFYTVQLGFGDFSAAGERMKDKSEAQKLAESCKRQSAAVTSVTETEKTEKAPALYDLTTLQRDANRLLGYTAQQTLDYLQSLYEKKLCTYPRTDSRFLTDDMEDSVNSLVLLAAGICGTEPPSAVISAQVCNSKKVSDHHAIVPTVAGGEADLGALPAGEREILLLLSRQVLMAVSESFIYKETVAKMDCNGNEFTAKGKALVRLGWRVFAEKEKQDKTIPALSEGQVIPVSSCEVKAGKTTPPKHFTEDLLLSAMETAGKEDMPEDAERKGIGTPATRAGIIEKLISAGFAERKSAKKAVHLIPSAAGVSLITVLPEQLQSPLLTAEWEHRLKEIERGETDADAFLAGIGELVSSLVRECVPVEGAETLFPSGRPVVGKCPRCGADVTESKNGYFCERRSCKFGLWRDNRFLTAKKISLTKKMASSLLADGRTYASGIYSEKTGKTYDAFIVLEDDGTKSSYRLEFGK